MGPSQCSKELLCFHKKPARLETTAQSLKKRPRCLFFFANFCLFLSSDLSYLLLTDRLVLKARWSVNVTQKDQMLANVDQQGQCGTILTNVGQCLPMLTNVEQFWPMSANNVDQCWTIFNNFDRCRQIMLTNVEQHPDGFPFWPVITSTLRRWPPFILCSAQQFSHNATNSSTEREEWASDILFCIFEGRYDSLDSITANKIRFQDVRKLPYKSYLGSQV